MRVGSLFAGIGGFDLGLERAGMEIAWQVEIDPRLQPLAPRTSASGSGLWPTPVAQDDGKTPEAHMRMKANMKGGPRYKPTSLTVMVKGIERHLWATPSAADAVGSHGGGQGRSLRTDIHEWKKEMWPTPAATDYKGSGKTGDLRDRLDYAVERGGTKSKTYEPPKTSVGS